VDNIAPIEPLYEDNHLLAVYKPAGMLTQPNDSGQNDLESMAKAYIKQKYNKPGAVFLHAVHRLDKPVQGIVLFARTSKALERMNELMRAKQIRKVYRATVEGSLPQEKGRLEHWMVHRDHHAAVVAGKAADPDAALAILEYQVLERKGAQTSVEVTLVTGRYHQIRAQLSAIGCPVVGDSKYGSVHSLPGGNIALEHTEMVFIHPVTGKEIRITT
jgi:23S rRNA pseudouridine1911/1915/1917 synthase